MSGKVIEMPKSNGQLWNDLFKSFLGDIDKVAAHQKAQQFGRCGESAGLEQKQAGTVPEAGQDSKLLRSGAELTTPPLINEQRPIQTYPGDPGPEPIPEAIVKEDV